MSNEVYIKNVSGSILSLNKLKLTLKDKEISKVSFDKEMVMQDTEVAICLKPSVKWVELVDKEVRKKIDNKKEVADAKAKAAILKKSRVDMVPGGLVTLAPNKSAFVGTGKKPKPEPKDAIFKKEGYFEKSTLAEKRKELEKKAQKALGALSSNVAQSKGIVVASSDNKDMIGLPKPNVSVQAFLDKKYQQKKNFIVETKDIGFLRDCKYYVDSKRMKSLIEQRIKELEKWGIYKA